MAAVRTDGPADRPTGDPEYDWVAGRRPAPCVRSDGRRPPFSRDDAPSTLVRGVGAAALAVLIALPGLAQQPVRRPTARPAAATRAIGPQEAALANPLPPLREQARVRAGWVRFRLDSVLPGLMRKHDVQMWIVCGRENNDDPVYGQLVPGLGSTMGRRTILVFYDPGEGRPVERLALGGGGTGYRAVRDTGLARQMGSFGQDRFVLLRRVVEERDPRSIAIDVSPGDAYADGLSAGDLPQIQAALGPAYWPRLRFAEGLVLDYLAVRAPGMLETYVPLQQLAHDVIATAFSREVITPGVTRAGDVAWWARQKLNDLGLGAWFDPYVTVQRQGADGDTLNDPVLLPGDVLHIDFGLTGLGLNTDTQHMAYILRPGETAPPPGLVAALRNANRLQDIVLGEMRAGRTGNEVLTAALAAMRAAGIDGAVYGHPVGDHGHAAGPYVGLWDRQDTIAGRGEVRFLTDTWHSVELAATTPVPEWGNQRVTMYEEEDALIAPDGTARWVLRRQSELLLIR